MRCFATKAAPIFSWVCQDFMRELEQWERDVSKKDQHLKATKQIVEARPGLLHLSTPHLINSISSMQFRQLAIRSATQLPKPRRLHLKLAPPAQPAQPARLPRLQVCLNPVCAVFLIRVFPLTEFSRSSQEVCGASRPPRLGQVQRGMKPCCADINV